MNAPLSPDAVRQLLPALWVDEPGEPKPHAPRLLVRLVVALAGLMVLLFGLAAIVPIGGAVIGGGQVGVESRVKRIAHPTGGVITAIAVINGQHVRQGELLMRLDDRVTGADATYSNLTVEQLLAQKARLEAERLGLGQVVFPPQLTGSANPSARKAMADEQHLFAMRQTEEGQLRAQLAARVVQYNQQITGLQAQIDALRQQRHLIEPERQGVRDLWDKQLVTINRLNQLERTAVDIDGQVAQLQSQIAQTRARITEAQEQSIQTVQTRRVQAGTDLAQVNTSLNQQQLRNVSASDQKDRSEIRAPYSGTIEKIAFAAIGDVVRPAEPIMEIVPDHDVMVVEASISPTDVDQVRVGQAARVRFSAFNRAATPEIPGRVVYVATDRTDNQETRQAYYTVRIEVDQGAIQREGLALRSGMPAETYIETGNRSLLSYVTKPLRDQFMRAFRDN
ncbi:MULTISPECIES: HlyD family type I secretion periplasmic adaptor subunit [unclassified Novosphingobium]|uniref:HlyD family type I secretion periplasmic adaptor subunit n=1 Tax=Novosphingobium TaxID=165696 RepID=UPI0014477693|nr:MULTISPECIES: HlyD family type I secretion periplasmic adaptor subunit [unclassified Novosphingobium]NKJ43845.1 HlyD family secretion protein [Novosphingobium sp. SG720]NMN06308.1 HlyD family secretion protein [Novosphingobium sp. SG919]NMN88606.1 HlyD family secretion protein [Novosphingobium sp. SG916]